jgi:hypothetical protein
MWEVHYADGPFVTSEDHTPSSIDRRDDVQVIIQPDSEHNWVTVSGDDYYMWDERGGNAQWFGGDREGLSSYLRKPGYKCVLIGGMIDKYLFRKILNKAIERLGEKAGYNSIERHPCS